MVWYLVIGQEFYVNELCALKIIATLRFVYELQKIDLSKADSIGIILTRLYQSIVMYCIIK